MKSEFQKMDFKKWILNKWMIFEANVPNVLVLGSSLFFLEPKSRDARGIL